MAELIPALTPVTASWIRSRKRRAGHADDFEFAHWLADDAEANDKRGGGVAYPVPVMSTEGHTDPRRGPYAGTRARSGNLPGRQTL
jgi:hypothetical protein